MKEGCGVGFLGLGAYVPDEIRRNDWWPHEWRERHQSRVKRDLVGTIDEATRVDPKVVDPEVARHSARYAADLFRGTRERRVIAEDQAPSDLEAAACRAALEDAGLAPEEVELLLVYSVVPDYPAPTNHGVLARKIGLSPAIFSFGLYAGCASFLPELSVATQLIRGGEGRNALVVAGSATTRVTDFNQPSSVFVGDGAAAGVMGPVEDGLGYIGRANRTRGDLSEALCIYPHDRPSDRWYETGELTAMPLDRPALHHVGVHAASLCSEVCHEVLESTGYEVADVDYFIVAQSTAWFGAALAEAVGIPEGRYLPPQEHFERYGHMMGASAPMNLFLAYRGGHLKKGDLVLMYSPGVGFVQSAVLYRWNLDPPAS